MRKLRAGIIGCGNISDIYMKNLQTFPHVELAGCADLDRSRAEAKAEKHGLARAYDVEELLADPSVDIIVNLTIPQAHAEVNRKALLAGKHVYVEKPFAVETEDGLAVLQLAREKGLRVGCAPDTFLGAGIQTCIGLIQEGAIGIPVAATAFMLCGGHESWHPDPAFYYAKGGGPMLDMGPYYLTALVSMLGPIRRISGSAAISHPERTITSQPKHGEKIRVEVPTHLAGTMEFASGAIGTVVMSFDVPGGHHLPRIEIYGSEGTLSVPDPNTFGGPVLLRRKGSAGFEEVALTHPYAENSRGLGVADLALGVIEEREHRAGGELACHVLEAMHAFGRSSDTGTHIVLGTSCALPEPMPKG
ncbi:Gfo/Idh/MocA family protein [Gorillibacterium sp. sgz5001074]|uniref:Gfo/Idh/MocA family protein n=1 Tax=Gorillibacterium sp. sgz5001074 TaxID=3446695 RepID=UPI003F66F162